MRRIFGAIIHCNCSFFQKDLAEFVVRYCSMKNSHGISRYDLSPPRDLCCLQPWQHSVYQLCRCVWDHLCTLLLVVIVAKVSNYSTKKKPLHKQVLHPAEIPKALKRDGLLGFTTRIIWKLRLTSFVVNLPRSGRPQICLWKRTVYVETVQNKHWQKMPEFTQK